MTLHRSDLPTEISELITEGTAIPAHPLALDADRKLDRIRQRALSRYYLDAGAGGLAVGVHTTQFAIREVGLYAPVLETAAETAAGWCDRPVALIAGISGGTEQATKEARTARSMGYHFGLLSLSALKGSDHDDLIDHCRAIAAEIPLFGFYLQPSVGGMPLSARFWRDFAAIDNVVAIKIAPFNRYATLDVIGGVLEAGAEDRVTLYTGNDDHIVLDLLTPFTLVRKGREKTLRIRGGLLGHWSVWTKAAVDLHRRCRRAADNDSVPVELLELDAQVTECNAALFDVANGFKGCIAGCHEILRRQGLLEGTWCLDPEEAMSPGQSEELTRVQEAYPHLTDDVFVSENLHRWLS